MSASRHRLGSRRWVAPWVVGLVAVVTAVGACTSSSTPIGRPPSLTPSPVIARLGSPTPGVSSASPPAAIPSPPPAPSPPALGVRLRATLDLVFAGAARGAAVPGAQASVLFSGGGLWTGTYGFADLAARRPMTAADLFDIGSVTKTFMAAAFLQLANEGRLSLGDPLARWLPAYPNAARITLLELLDHTSGIADYFNNPRLITALDANHSAVWSPPMLLRYIGKPLFAPGTSWSYSNSNYLLLGMVLREVTGLPAEVVLNDLFFGPLGLASTTLQGDVPLPQLPAAAPLAMPYAPGRTRNERAPTFRALSDGSRYLPFTALATALDTAGSVVSTSTDLARWARALYGGDVLPPASLAEMLDAGLTRRFRPPRAYGLGAEHLRLAGFDTVGHSGACSGYRATMRYVPALGVAVVVLVNEDGPDPDAIAARLIAAIAGPAWSGGYRPRSAPN